MNFHERFTPPLEPSAITIKAEELLTDGNKDVFRVLWTLHRMYPNCRILLSKDRELDLAYIDKLREKERV